MRFPYGQTCNSISQEVSIKKSSAQIICDRIMETADSQDTMCSPDCVSDFDVLRKEVRE